MTGKPISTPLAEIDACESADTGPIFIEGWPTETSASAAIVRDVLAGLYDGRYEPGQRLVEANLTAIFGISRGPVREALKGLAALGIVDITPQRGAQIKVLTVSQAIDILVIASALLSCAARLAASNIEQSGARERMQSALDCVANFAKDDNSQAFAHARNHFYAAITRIAGNGELRRILPSAQIHIIRVQFRAVLQAHDTTRLVDYKRITDAVLAGDATAAESAMRLHLNRPIASLVAYRAKIVAENS